MDKRKIYCEVLEGVTYDDRCLFKLSKVIEGNPVCENCILRELQILKRCEPKQSESESGSAKKEKATRGERPRVRERSERAKKARKVTNDGKVTNISDDIDGPGPIISGTERAYTVKAVAELLKKSRRRIQELAKAGNIPGARKVDQRWEFDKTIVEQWLSKAATASPQRHDNVRTEDSSCQGPDPDRSGAAGALLQEDE